MADSKSSDKPPTTEKEASKGAKKTSSKVQEESGDSAILACLQDIQRNQRKYDSKVDGLMDRLKKKS